MVGLQQGTAKGLRRDLQDRNGCRDCSHRRVARVPERMAAGNHPGVQPLVALSSADRRLSHQLQSPEIRGVYR